MTIYTGKASDKKEEEAIFPQVVTDVLVRNCFVRSVEQNNMLFLDFRNE